MTKHSPIIVIGAGASGISCAYYLALLGLKCIILESSKYVGGIGAAHNTGKYLIERTYHSFYRGDTEIFTNICALDLKKSIIWGEPKLGYVINGRLRDFSSPFDIVANPDMKISDKMRLFWLTYLTNRTKPWQNLDKIRLKQWIYEHGSDNLYRYLFEPLVNARWGDFSDNISAAWLWGRIHPRASSRRLDGREKVGYIEGSFQRLLDLMLGKALAQGSILKLATECVGIKVEKNTVASVEYINGDGRHFIEHPTVISTIPIPQFMQIIKGIDSQWRNALNRVKYMNNICLVVSMKRQLMNLCQIPVAPGQASFSGIIEWTNFVPRQYFNNETLLYIFSYLSPDHQHWQKTDKELTEMYLADLKEIIKSFNANEMNWSLLFRNRYATPVYEKDYLDYMPAPVSKYRGLYLSGIFNTYPVSDYNCVMIMARRVTQLISEELKKSGTN